MEEKQIGTLTIDDLNFRRTLCREIIRVLSGIDVDDPRRDDAVKEYQRQLAEIDKKIETITGTPPPVVVGLKTAVLFAKSEKP